MKKTIALVLVAALLLSSCGTKNNMFERANWGDTISSVKRSESRELFHESEDLLLFLDSVDGYDTEIYYHFSEGVLVNGQVKYLIGEHTLDECAVYYVQLRDQMIERYGEPVSPDYKVWLADDESFRLDREGLSLYQQRVVFSTEWVTEDAYYSLMLFYRDLQTTFAFYACDPAHFTESPQFVFEPAQ